jgi:hypothetical protein
MVPKLWIMTFSRTGRGAFRGREGVPARYAGAFGKANVGISNDNAGEKPAHRKTKVS